MWHLGHRHQRILLMPQKAPSSDEDPEPCWHWVHCTDQRQQRGGSHSRLDLLGQLDPALPCVLVMPPHTIALVALERGVLGHSDPQASLDTLIAKELCVNRQSLAVHVLNQDHQHLDVMVIQRGLLAQCLNRLHRQQLHPAWWSSAFQGLPLPDPGHLAVLPWGDDWMLKWRQPQALERERWLSWPKSQELEQLSQQLPDELRDSPWNCPLAPDASSSLDCLAFFARHLPVDLPRVPEDMQDPGELSQATPETA
nr:MULTISPECIES: type II secretion system protein GspL [unclassified Halomonas]